MKKIKYKYLALYISVVAIVSSVIISWYTIHSSNEQFTILNQSYVDAEPHAEIKKMTGAESGDLRIKELEFSLIILNVGNLPLTYKVVQCDVILGDEVYQDVVLSEDMNEGILYPDRIAEVSRRIIYDGEGIGYATIRPMMKWRIEYQDIGGTHVKTVERSGNFTFLSNGESTWDYDVILDNI